MTKVSQYYLIKDGVLAGTTLEPIMGLLAVKYPHRKTKDAYIFPYTDDEKHLTHPWHCCNENCDEPLFHGAMDRFIEHLTLHAGRSLKKHPVEG